MKPKTNQPQIFLETTLQSYTDWNFEAIIIQRAN